MGLSLPDSPVVVVVLCAGIYMIGVAILWGMFELERMVRKLMMPSKKYRYGSLRLAFITMAVIGVIMVPVFILKTT